MATPKFNLREHVSGQAAEIFYNENLNYLEIMLVASVLSIADNDPPASPNEGDSYIIGTTPVNDWVGHPNEITGYYGGVWVFIQPEEGFRFYVRDLDDFRFFNGTSWVDD